MKLKSLLFLIILLTCFLIKSYGINHKPLRSGINGVYKFTGKLNGKIPVFLWFVVKDSVLKGEVTYLRTAERLPITIIGTINTNGIGFSEFAKTGSITGNYHGKFVANSFTGFWSVLGLEKTLKFNFVRKDTLLAHIDTVLKPVSINGQYSYQFGKDAAAGEVNIKQISHGNYLINIGCVTDAPARNLANVETFKAKMVNNIIIFKVPDSDCKFRIRAFNNFVVIDQITGSDICGFGNRASIDGVFIKTSTVPELRDNK